MRCTCWYGAYAKIGGGTGCDIVRYDEYCPVHGEWIFPDVSYITAQLEAIVAVAVRQLDQITTKIAAWRVA